MQRAHKVRRVSGVATFLRELDEDAEFKERLLAFPPLTHDLGQWGITPAEVRVAWHGDAGPGFRVGGGADQRWPVAEWFFGLLVAIWVSIIVAAAVHISRDERKEDPSLDMACLAYGVVVAVLNVRGEGGNLWNFAANQVLIFIVICVAFTLTEGAVG
jgi:hypothetical protein